MAKARRIYLVIALTLFPLLASEKASAQNATATILNGGLPGITLPFGGGAFTFDINIVTTFSSVGIDNFLQSNDGNGFFSSPGVISLVHRSKVFYLQKRSCPRAGI